MRARRVLVQLGLVALAAGNTWCASDEEATPRPPVSDGGADTGAPADAGDGDENTELPEVPTCNEAFCRVTPPGAEAVALDGVLARSSSEVWVVGSTGYAARFDGTSWRRITTGTKATIFAISASGDGTVWGASAGDAFLVLNREVDGGAEIIDGGFSGIVRAIGTVGAREAWAVGDAFVDFFADPPPPVDFIWRYAPVPGGTSWEWQPVSPPCPPGEFGQPACLKLNAVWAESAERVWFAGDEGKVFRADTSGLTGGDPADGGEPSPRLELEEMNSSSLRKLEALWGFGPNDVWAVGTQGVIRHWVGGDAWAIVPSPVAADLHAVWGARPDDVWAVGDDGVVLHWDGDTWTITPTPYAAENRPRLYAVSGTGGDVWIAGEGTLLRTNRAAEGDR